MWYVHYRKNSVPGLQTLGTLPLAVAAACALLDQGGEVGGIEGDGGLAGMSANEIGRVYAERKAAKARR